MPFSSDKFSKVFPEVDWGSQLSNCDADTNDATRTASGVSDESRIDVSRSRHVVGGPLFVTSRFGYKLWAKKWPVAVVFAISFVLFASTLVHGFVSLPDGHSHDKGDAKVTRFSVPLLLLTVAFVWLAVVILWHQVYKELLIQSIKSFDCLVITLSVLRMWVSFVYSRSMMVDDLSTCAEDLMWFVLYCGWIFCYISVDAALLDKRVKLRVAIGCVFTGLSFWANAVFNAADWDPTAETSSFWVAPMAPRNQFCSASLVASVLMAKGCWSLAQGRDFLFIHTRFSPANDDAYLLFKSMDTDGDNVITSEEWEQRLDALKISQELAKESFGMFEGSHRGYVTLRAFRVAFTRQLEKNAGMSQSKQLSLFCKRASRRRLGVDPLSEMLSSVLEQWVSLNYDKLGKLFYARLVQNVAIRKLFHRQSLEVHAVVFVGILSMAMGWLREGRFFSLAQKMDHLGEGHVKMGVTVRMLPTFQSALLMTLEDMSRGEFHTRNAWSFVWMQFIAKPFLNGLLRRSNVGVKESLPVVRASFPELIHNKVFMERMEHELNPSSEEEQAHTADNVARQRPTFSLGAFVSSRMWSSTLPGSQTPYFVAFIEDALGNCPLRRPGDPGGPAAEMFFWEKHPGVKTSELIFLTDAFMSSLGEDISSDEAAKAWAWMFTNELIESRLMVPFALVEADLEALVSGFDAHEELNYVEITTRLMAMGFPEGKVLHLFRSLTQVKDTVSVTWSSFRRSVMNQAMMDPGGTLNDALLALCCVEDFGHESHLLM